MPVDETYVYLHLAGEFVPAGLLTLHQTNDKVVSEFAYGRRYLERENAAPLDPLQLPLIRSEFQTSGVFRAFQDASPDAWGRHLLDRAAEDEGVVPTEFEYLTVQDQENRIGAIAFGPDLDGPRPTKPSWRPEEISGERVDFAEMVETVDKILNHEKLSPAQRRFFIRGSSAGGAQPKTLVDYDGKKWIAKFSRELELWPTCRIELAAMSLAAKCGIRVPFCRVLDVGGRDVFLTERFDRTEGGGREHFLSAMTLIGSDHIERGAYGDIAMAIRKYGDARFIRKDLEELFRRMVFNVLVNNWDDHLRNHGFLYDPGSGHWRLSPAYDIVPQPQREGEEEKRLTLALGERGSRATIENALSRCGDYSLRPEVAKEIVDGMVQVVRRGWERENAEAGVPADKIRLVEEAYRLVLVRG
ncbi:MAG: type II toxin-antitoxin system HipA family toxin [Desulfovibrio sp.]